MADVSAHCSECNKPVITKSQDIIVTYDYVKGKGSYEFQCPRCLRYIEKPADFRVVNLLISAGAKSRMTNVPKEVFERPDSRSKITESEIKEFCEDIGSESWMQRFAKDI